MMDPWEIDLLIKYAKLCRIHFVEIGTYLGGATALISKFLRKDIKMTTIDIFDKVPRGSLPPSEIPPTYEEAKETIEKDGVIEKVNIIKGISWEVAKDWKQDIDVLFIDGDHRYSAVKRDFYSWEPHVVKNGNILIHDVHLRSVAKAVNEIIQNQKYKIVDKSGSFVVIK